MSSDVSGPTKCTRGFLVYGKGEDKKGGTGYRGRCRKAGKVAREGDAARTSEDM